ncbi:hypothetical protein Gotur_004633 [Gossypium turneri]
MVGELNPNLPKFYEDNSTAICGQQCLVEVTAFFLTHDLRAQCSEPEKNLCKFNSVIASVAVGLVYAGIIIIMSPFLQSSNISDS